MTAGPSLSRIEAEWIVSHALLVAKVITLDQVRRGTLLPVPCLMRRCQGCGRTFYSECLDCLYRGGGQLMDTLDEHAYEPDLLDQMRAVRLDGGWRLENSWHAWRRPLP